MALKHIYKLKLSSSCSSSIFRNRSAGCYICLRRCVKCQEHCTTPGDESAPQELCGERGCAWAGWIWHWGSLWLEVLSTHPALPNTNSCSAPNPLPGNVVHILPKAWAKLWQPRGSCSDGLLAAAVRTCNKDCILPFPPAWESSSLVLNTNCEKMFNWSHSEDENRQSHMKSGWRCIWGLLLYLWSTTVTEILLLRRENEFGSKQDFEVGKQLYLQAPRSVWFSRTQDLAAGSIYNAVAVIQRGKTGTSCSKRGRALLPTCPGKGAGTAGAVNSSHSAAPLPPACSGSSSSLLCQGSFGPPEPQGGLSSADVRFREQEPCLFLADLPENRMLRCCEPELGCLWGQTWEPGNERQSCSRSHLCKHFLPVLIINLLSLFVPCSTLMFLTRAAFFRSHGGFCKRLCHDHDHFIEFYSSHQLLQLLKRCQKC